MAEKNSRLSEIFEYQKSQGKGTLGSLTSAFGKKSLEMLDVRNLLFGSSREKPTSLAQSLGRSLFGAGYSAVPRREIGKSDFGEVSNVFNQKIERLLSSIDSNINLVNTKASIIAKNSVQQNRTARDINVIRQNVVLLTKDKLGTARTKADMYFMRAKQREAEYERQFKNNEIEKDDISNKTEKKEKDKKSSRFGLVKSLLGFGSILAILGNIDSIINFFKKLKEKLSDLDLNTILNSITNFFKDIKKNLSELNISSLTKSFGDLKKSLLSFSEDANKFLENVKSVFGSLFTTMNNEIEAIKQKGFKIWSGEKIDSMVSFIKDFDIKSVLGSINQEKMAEWLTVFIQKMVEALVASKDFLMGVISKIPSDVIGNSIITLAKIFVEAIKFTGETILRGLSGLSPEQLGIVTAASALFGLLFGSGPLGIGLVGVLIKKAFDVIGGIIIAGQFAKKIANTVAKSLGGSLKNSPVRIENPLGGIVDCCCPDDGFSRRNRRTSRSRSRNRTRQSRTRTGTRQTRTGSGQPRIGTSPTEKPKPTTTEKPKSTKPTTTEKPKSTKPTTTEKPKSTTPEKTKPTTSEKPKSTTPEKTKPSSPPKGKSVDSLARKQALKKLLTRMGVTSAAGLVAAGGFAALMLELAAVGWTAYEVGSFLNEEFGISEQLVNLVEPSVVDYSEKLKNVDLEKYQPMDENEKRYVDEVLAARRRRAEAAKNSSKKPKNKNANAVAGSGGWRPPQGGVTGTQNFTKTNIAKIVNQTNIKQENTTSDESIAELNELLDDEPTSPNSNVLRIQNTPAGLPSNFDYDMYTKRVGKMESGNDYGVVNTIGYAGRYQFGAQALETVGLLKPGTYAKYNSNKGMQDPSNWKHGLSLEKFLQSPEIQDDAMKKLTEMNYKKLTNDGIVNQNMNSKELSGWLYVAHGVGAGGAMKFAKGENPAEGYGTTASQMFAKASGMTHSGDSATQFKISQSPRKPEMFDSIPAMLGGMFAATNDKMGDLGEMIVNIINNNAPKNQETLNESFNNVLNSVDLGTIKDMVSPFIARTLMVQI